MMTGDNVGTARAIAERCGIISKGDKFLVLEGKELEKKICDSDGQVLNAVCIVCTPYVSVICNKLERQHLHHE